jgi:hypothetical protein
MAGSGAGGSVPFASLRVWRGWICKHFNLQVCSLCILGESGELLGRVCSDDGYVYAVYIDDAIYDDCGEDATVDGRVLAALLKPRLVMWTVERAGANWAAVGARPVTEGCTSHLAIPSPHLSLLRVRVGTCREVCIWEQYLLYNHTQ